MSRGVLAGQLLGALLRERRVMLAVLPGLALTMLHSTALDLPRADVIDALDSDHYRILWIVGAYVLGSAVGMALTRFVGGRLGLRLAYILGLILFTVAASACAATPAVVWMTPLRLIQGLGTGLVISVGMVLVWRAFPVHKELAMALYGMAVYLPALLGAPLGGLLTAWATWRLIFLINLPLGSLIAAVAWTVLPPDRPATRDGGSFDWLGLALLVAVIVPLNVVLDLGQYWGWLASPYFVPWLAALVTGLILFVAWGVLAEAPLIGLRPLAVRHFALGLAIKVLFSINLYLLVGLLSGYMINLRGYQWWQGSLVLLPGFVTMLLGVLLGTWIGTDGNRKARMFAGLAVMALATWQLSTVDVYTAKGWQALMTALWGAGAGVVCGPALLTTFEGLSNEATLQTAGVFNIMRSLPTFVAAGVLATLLTQRTDTNFDWLRLNMRDERPVVVESLRQPAEYFVERGSGDATAVKQSHALLGKWTQANARGLAFRDVFQMLTLAPLLGLVLVLMLRVPPQSPRSTPTPVHGGSRGAV